MEIKGGWIPVGGLCGFIVATSHIDPEVCSLDTVTQYVQLDFLLHGGMYAMLGYTVARRFSSSFTLGPPLLGFLTCVSCVLFGCLHEYYQLWTDGRAPELLDLSADLAGGFVGAATCLCTSHPVSTPARMRKETGPVLKGLSLLSTGGLFLCALLLVPVVLQALEWHRPAHTGSGESLRDNHPGSRIGRLRAVLPVLRHAEALFLQDQLRPHRLPSHPRQGVGKNRTTDHSSVQSVMWEGAWAPPVYSHADGHDTGRASRFGRTFGYDVTAVHSHAGAFEQPVSEGKGRQRTTFVATIVSCRNPIDGLNWLDACKLLCCKGTSWKCVGMEDLPVCVVTTIRDSSTIERHMQSVFREGVKQRILKVAFSSLVVAYVAEHPGAIGLMTLKDARQLRWIERSGLCKVVPIRLETRHPDSYF